MANQRIGLVSSSGRATVAIKNKIFGSAELETLPPKTYYLEGRRLLSGTLGGLPHFGISSVDGFPRIP